MEVRSALTWQCLTPAPRLTVILKLAARRRPDDAYASAMFLREDALLSTLFVRSARYDEFTVATRHG